jgi:hypothetical protein
MAAKLGELLASRGKLDRELLLRALRAQRGSGGRLGTVLLELDAVREDEILHVLSDQLKVPFVEPDDLRSIPQDVLRLVPAKTAAKLCAVPVRASASQLSVAMLDPLDLAALDELAFVSGRRVRPHTALECRLQEALARHYGIDTPRRFVQLADRLNRSQFLWREAHETPAPPAVEVARPAAPAVPPSPYPEAPAPMAPPRSEPPRPLPALPRPAAPSPQPPAAPQPVPPARARLGFEEAEQRLLQPADRDAVAETLIDFLVGRVDVGLALMVRRQEALGWRGCGLPNDVAAAVRVPLGEPSVVLALRDGAPLHRGALPPLKGNAPLIAAVGADATDLIALPLRVRDRLVGVLLAIQRRGAFEAGLSDDLQRLAVKASGALELLVLRQKLGRA